MDSLPPVMRGLRYGPLRTDLHIAGIPISVKEETGTFRLVDRPHGYSCQCGRHGCPYPTLRLSVPGPRETRADRDAVLLQLRNARLEELAA